MVDHQRHRREQDALLHQKLKEKQEMEEYIECTFTPKTHCRYKSRSPEELLKVMNPLISEEKKILEELRKLEAEENSTVQHLSRDLRAYIASNRGVEEDLIRICERYREERLKELSRVKNRKLDIVGLLHEVERKYNVICVREHLSEDEMSRAGFNIESCRCIKKEILDSVKGVDTLKDRSRVTAEIETLIRKAKEDAERQRMCGVKRGVIPGHLPAGMPSAPHYGVPMMGTHVPYPMVKGMHPGFLPMFGGAKAAMNMRPQQMMPGYTMSAQMPLNKAAVSPGPNVQATGAAVTPQGFVPINPAFAYPNMQHAKMGPIMFQRNRPKKLQQ